MFWGEAISKGAAVGLGLAFVIGPIFLKLISITMQEGFQKGARFAFGIFLSDFVFATLFWVGVGGFLIKLGQSMTLAIAGGVVLILLGISSLTRKMVPFTDDAEPKPEAKGLRARFGPIGKGFIMNFLNPGTSVVWLGAGTAGADLAARGGLALQGVYLGSILITVFSTDVLKAYLARSLKDYLTPRHIRNVNRVAGLLMIAAGSLIIITVATRWIEGLNPQ